MSVKATNSFIHSLTQYITDTRLHNLVYKYVDIFRDFKNRKAQKKIKCTKIKTMGLDHTQLLKTEVTQYNRPEGHSVERIPPPRPTVLVN